MISDILNFISSWNQRVKDFFSDRELKKINLKELKAPKKQYDTMDEIILRDTFLSASINIWILLGLFMISYLVSVIIFDGVLI